MSCVENYQAAVGPYAVENNMWGKDGVYGSYSQCVGMATGLNSDGSVSAKWTWQFPAGPSEVKSFPNIRIGQRPGLQSTPGSNLPRRLDQVNTVTTSWNTQSTHTGTGQLAYDLWLTADPNVYPGGFPAAPITHEIMVALEPYGGYGLDRNPAWYVEETTINGIRYKVYKADNFGLPNRQWRFLVFQMLTPMVAGNLDFKPLFTYLKNKGFISGTEYLSSFEFGTEAVEGTGTVNIRSFKATID